MVVSVDVVLPLPTILVVVLIIVSVSLPRYTVVGEGVVTTTVLVGPEEVMVAVVVTGNELFIVLIV